MLITVLVENTRGDVKNVLEEYGLSLLIENDDRTVLFDTGSSGVFAENAKTLGKNLADVEWLVISHGHYDHGGGIGSFFEQNEKAKAVIRKGADRSLYGSLVPGLPGVMHKIGLVTRYIGLDSAMLEKHKNRFVWINENMQLTDGFNIITGIEHKHALPKANQHLLAINNGRYERDDFCHELVLVAIENNEAVVFSGCSHSGIMNILEAVKNDNPEIKIKALVGGFHLKTLRSEKMSDSDDEVRRLASQLDEIVDGKIYTGHCTGQQAFDVLKEELGQKISMLHTGDSFEL